MPGVIVDGIDFFAVYEAAGEAIARARAGGGPTLLECKIDPLLRPLRGRRSRPTAARARSRTHPRQRATASTRFAQRVTGAGLGRRGRAATRSTTTVRALIDEAVARGQGRALTRRADDLLTDVYVSY